MDSALLYKHLEWVKSIESAYEYVEEETESDLESESEEFSSFFEVAGEVGGGALGLAMGGWVGCGALAAIFHSAGAKIDKKLGL
jgi:hypothetical protein